MRVLSVLTTILVSMLPSGGLAGCTSSSGRPPSPSSPVVAQTPQMRLPGPEPVRRSALHVARLFDGSARVEGRRPTVFVEGAIIVAVDPDGGAREGFEDIDLGDVTMLPGLIDAHTHVMLESDPALSGNRDILLTVLEVPMATRVLRAVPVVRDLLMAGFTTVRDVGNSGDGGDVALRDAIAAGWMDGPRMVVSTRALAPVGGQFSPLAPEAEPLIATEYAVVRGAEDARQAVRRALQRRADWIKVIVSEENSILSLAELTAITEEAHRAHVQVAAHAIGELSTEIAVAAGVDSLEHGRLISEKTLTRMAAQGTWLVPTAHSVQLSLARFSATGRPTADEVRARETGIRTRRAGLRRDLELARRLNVPLAFGSDFYNRVEDLGYTRGQAIVQQLIEYGDLGFSAEEVLRLATRDTARMLRFQGRLGTVAPSAIADLVAVRGDPMHDLRALAEPVFVMKEGRVVRDERRAPTHH